GVAPSTVNLSFQTGTNSAFVNQPVIAITGPDGNWSSNITYNNGTGWLSLSPSAGALPGQNTTTIKADPGSLAVGTYSATVTITTAGGTAAVLVNLNVGQSAVLLTTPGSAVFTYQTGGVAPAGLSVFGANSDGSPVTFTATAVDSWVKVVQQTGSTA